MDLRFFLIYLVYARGRYQRATQTFQASEHLRGLQEYLLLLFLDLQGVRDLQEELIFLLQLGLSDQLEPRLHLVRQFDVRRTVQGEVGPIGFYNGKIVTKV